MCGRFYIESEDTPAELEHMLEEAAGRMDEPLQKGEIGPGDTACVLAPSRQNGSLRPFAMRWGFPLERKLVINARLETAPLRPMFRESYRIRRCLIPASGWFEWDHREKRPPKYRFHASRTPWLWLAGLYRHEPGSPPRFVVVTRPAEGDIALFHDRMPLCFEAQDGNRWLLQESDGDFAALGAAGIQWERQPGAPEQISMLSST